MAFCQRVIHRGGLCLLPLALAGCVELYIVPVVSQPPTLPPEVNVYTTVESPPPQSAGDVNVTLTSPPAQVGGGQRYGCPIFMLPEPSAVPTKPDLVNATVKSPGDVEKILVHYIDRLRGYIQGNRVDIKRRYNEYIEQCR